MEHVRFYEEYTDKRKGISAGNVFAAFVGNGWHGPKRDMIEGLGAVYFHPNSPVCGTSASAGWLADNCKRVSEKRAREIHPNLFARLDET